MNLDVGLSDEDFGQSGKNDEDFAQGQLSKCQDL